MAARNGIPTSTARIGQLSGSLKNGAWNLTNWFPKIIQVASLMKVIPTMSIDLPVTWLPVDVAAQTVCNGIAIQIS